MCSRPRKPQRKPKPSACDTSGSNISAASFSLSFSSESRSWSYSELSTGYRPANTCGLTSLKPGSGAAAGLLASVTVSPTLASSSCLMPAMMKPTSPADRCGRCCDFGVNTPVCSHRWVAPDAISRILSWLEHAVDDTHQHHHAHVVVEPRVDDQRLQRRPLAPARGPRWIPGSRRCPCRSWRWPARPARRRCRSRPRLPGARLGIGLRQVHLVQHRHHFHAQLDGGVAVGHGLRLDPWEASTTSSAPSQADSERLTSYEKSTCPGCR